MEEYVAGLLFSHDKRKVALILKTHPEWQAGKYNAIGGRVEIENEEHPNDAMRREFREETGLNINTWREFASLQDERGWIVRFYWAIGRPLLCRSLTEEEVAVFYLTSLPDNIIPNLRWLIPMALSMADERCDGFVIREFKRLATTPAAQLENETDSKGHHEY